MEIPLDRLSPEALRGLVEAFVLREGTDYGLEEIPLAVKVAQVIAQLREGRARILFDPESESFTIASVE